MVSEDAAFGFVDISSPANEVMGAFRINGVAGDLNRDDVEPGLGQDAPEKRHEIPVADTPKRGFDQTLTRPQYSADQGPDTKASVVAVPRSASSSSNFI
jgi:hypothetical protein